VTTTGERARWTGGGAVVPRAGHGLSRRRFLQGTLAAVGTVSAAPWLGAPFSEPLAATEDWWLGPNFWANRLQDWALRSGKLTCVAVPGKRGLCTVAVLTRRLTGGTAQVKVVTGTQSAGAGFSGLLVGTGGLASDYRRAALVGRASGTGGGLLCVYGSDGRVRFREHTNENAQLAYAEIASTPRGPAPARTTGERVRLTLDITAQSGSRVSLSLQATNVSTGALLSRATVSGIDAAAVTGGIALVSAGSGSTEATYWLNSIAASGAGAKRDRTRELGPIVGVLFSQADGTLKMTAQLSPMLPRSTDEVWLEVLTSDGRWVRRATAKPGVGYAAALRVEDWDGGTATGRIPAEPAAARLTVAAVSCSKASHRVLDRESVSTPRLPGEQLLGLYTKANVYFPYEDVVGAVGQQQPDLLVALGDQYYENSPTAKEQSPSPDHDFFYRYLMWLWAWRGVTANTPTIVLLDDHDMYQGSFWGEGGVAIPPGGAKDAGGFLNSPDWVNLVQRVHTGHNPDPIDPAPVRQGIGVYFTTFRYGGVTFALLEDRKFKTSPDGAPGLTDEDDYDLLGDRQERMLADLAGTASPVVALTQTMLACVETDRLGKVIGSKDSNGWPTAARDRAVGLLKDAGAVVLSGDTHLAALVRHGGARADGPVQFCTPAVGTSHQRWFEPAHRLPNAGTEPHTGDATDRLGNDFRVLAVANPRVSMDTTLSAIGEPQIGDQALKQEGYGILVVDQGARTYRFEAWPRNVDPLAAGAKQMPGWPYTLRFEDA